MGIKINFKDAYKIKDAKSSWREVKGVDSSGTSFTWQSPTMFVVDTSISDRTSLFMLWGDDGVVPPESTVLGDITVDWGDGTIQTYSPTRLNYGDEYSLTGSFSHTYASVGTFIVKMTGTFPFTFTHALQWTSGSNVYYGPADTNITDVISVYGKGSNKLPRPFSSSLTSHVDFLPSSVTSLREAFRGCTTYNNTQVNSWVTTQVTNMNGTFLGATAFNQDISGWDTGNVTDMYIMFNNATAFNQDISSWDVSKVTNMSNMFSYATAFNQDISGWDTGNVTDMSSMFKGASSFNQDLGSLDIRNVTNMANMLNQCGMSTENYSRTLIGFAQSHYDGFAKSNITLNATLKTYNNTTYTVGNIYNDAVSARDYLVNTAGWTITDGGQV